MMRRDKVDHLLRAASTITGRSTFVLIGSSAVLLRCRSIPGDMLLTAEADLYVADAQDVEELSDAIDANIGQGSSFHAQYGYYCDGVSPETAIMPTDWRDRAEVYTSAACEGVSAIVPDPDDIALSKVAAWREKDRDWLTAGIRAGLLSLDAMKARLGQMPTSGPAISDMKARLSRLAVAAGVKLTG